MSHDKGPDAGADISRRAFAKVAGAAALLSTAPLAAASAASTSDAETTAPSESQRRTFPRGFLWGTASAAYQVEGAATEDGRGPSVWDTFSHTPGKTVAGATGDVSDDGYHRYKQDVQL